MGVEVPACSNAPPSTLASRTRGSPSGVKYASVDVADDGWPDHVTRRRPTPSYHRSSGKAAAACSLLSLVALVLIIRNFEQMTIIIDAGVLSLSMIAGLSLAVEEARAPPSAPAPPLPVLRNPPLTRPPLTPP
eukprot:5842832-Prymnesium_polylepis.2